MLFCVAARRRPRIVSELAVLSRRADRPMYRSSCRVVVRGRPGRRLSRDIPVVRTRSWSLEMTDWDTPSLLPIWRCETPDWSHASAIPLWSSSSFRLPTMSKE